MVPLIPLIYFSGAPHANLWAALVYLLASFTDILDGYIARRFNLISKLGRVLDPLADKLMSFCVLVCLIISGRVLFWAGAAFFIKEAAMGLGALVQYRKISDVPPSNILGKVSTSFFFSVCFLIMVLFHDYDKYQTLRDYAIIATIALNVVAFVIYVARFIKLQAAGDKTQATSGKRGTP